jgi:hypothetical protein
LNPAKILGIFSLIQRFPAEKNEVIYYACFFRKTVITLDTEIANTIPEPTYIGEKLVA